MADAFTELCNGLKAVGKPDRAEKEKSYQKSDWIHWGVAFPDMDRVIKANLSDLDGDALIDLAERLWLEPVWDCKIVAGRILALPRVTDLSRVWSFIVAKLPELDGWAVADNLGPAARKCLLADTRLLDEVETWLQHDSFWVRRATLVFTLSWAKEGMDPTRSLKWTSRMVDDKEWFIQKAIGWWLRELSKTNPETVHAFLDKYEPRLKSVAKKEARKYL